MLTDAAFHSAIRTAILAPSLHNTQPWRYTRAGDSIHVWADSSRWLHEEDPLGRELLISCGGGARHLVLGLRMEGLTVDWVLLPDPEDPLLVATVTVTGHRPATLLDTELYTAARLRHTDRSRFAVHRVNVNVVDRLRRVAEIDGCFLTELSRDDTTSLAVLTDHADRVLRTDPDLRAEANAWSVPAHLPTQGVPASHLGPSGRRGSPVTLRQFGHETADPTDDEPPVSEHPTLLVLGSDGDTRLDWVSCGWTLSDVLLTLTSEGLVASPITQPLELPAFRARLRAALSLTGFPQMVLRAGYPAGSGSPRTTRRDIPEVLGYVASGPLALDPGDLLT